MCTFVLIIEWQTNQLKSNPRKSFNLCPILNIKTDSESLKNSDFNKRDEIFVHEKRFFDIFERKFS
jgi:hypothetical protein